MFKNSLICLMLQKRNIVKNSQSPSINLSIRRYIFFNITYNCVLFLCLISFRKSLWAIKRKKLSLKKP